jgi:hypothetical protein
MAQASLSLWERGRGEWSRLRSSEALIRPAIGPATFSRREKG